MSAGRGFVRCLFGRSSRKHVEELFKVLDAISKLSEELIPHYDESRKYRQDDKVRVMYNMQGVRVERVCTKDGKKKERARWESVEKLGYPGRR